MTVAENIKRVRKEKGLTQKQLGEKCKMSESTLRQYELGFRNPKLETIVRIAAALEVNIFELMNKEDFLTQKNELKNFLTPERKKESEELEELIELYEKQQKEKAAKSAPKAFIIENGQRVEVDKPIKFTTSSRSHAQTEAYELFHSLLSEEWVMSQEQETVAVQLKNILGAYNSLNDAGRKEAVKRVEELTEIPRYTNPDEPPRE